MVWGVNGVVVLCLLAAAAFYMTNLRASAATQAAETVRPNATQKLAPTSYFLPTLTPNPRYTPPVFETPTEIPPPTAVAVTIEPAGGLPAPTGAFYLVGSPGAAL